MYVLSCTLTIQTNKNPCLAIKIRSHSSELAPFMASTIHTQPEVTCCNGTQLPGSSAACTGNAQRQSKPRLCQEDAEQHLTSPGHIPRRQLGAPQRFETHTGTCGHHRPEVLGTEAHGDGTAGKRQQKQGAPMEVQEGRVTSFS